MNTLIVYGELVQLAKLIQPLIVTLGLGLKEMPGQADKRTRQVPSRSAGFFSLILTEMSVRKQNNDVLHTQYYRNRVCHFKAIKGIKIFSKSRLITEYLSNFYTQYVLVWSVSSLFLGF